LTIPGSDIRFPNRAGHGEAAGKVDERGKPIPMFLLDRRDERGDRVRVRQIRRVRMRVGPSGAQRGGPGVDAATISIDENQLETIGGEAARDDFANLPFASNSRDKRQTHGFTLAY
jgi:hypothetical protein